MSNKVKVILSIACIVVGAGIFYFTTFSGSGGGDVSGGGDGKIWIKCVNPDCNQAYSLTPDELVKAQEESNINPTMPGQQALKCQKCGQQSAYVAVQCQKCKTVFIAQTPSPDQENPDFPDRCPNPNCVYSASEQAAKRQK